MPTPNESPSMPKCPKCGSFNVATERRINGNSVCGSCRHKWPNKKKPVEPAEAGTAEPKEGDTGRLTGSSKVENGRVLLEVCMDKDGALVWVDATDWKWPAFSLFIKDPA